MIETERTYNYNYKLIILISNHTSRYSEGTCVGFKQLKYQSTAPQAKATMNVEKPRDLLTLNPT
jgi:hypothetical protein